VGDKFPDFKAACSKTELSAETQLSWHNYIDGHWAILMSEPANTAVSATELGSLNQLRQEFEKRQIKICAFSCSSTESIELWSKDVATLSGDQLFFPIIADDDHTVANSLGLVDREHQHSTTERVCFIIDSDKCLQMILMYPASIGFSFVEILRVIDNLQTERTGVVTPSDWKPGGTCYVPEKEKQEEYAKLPQGVTKQDENVHSIAST